LADFGIGKIGLLNSQQAIYVLLKHAKLTDVIIDVNLTKLIDVMGI